MGHVNVTLFSRFSHFWTTFGISLLHSKLLHRNKHLHLAKSTTVYNEVFMLPLFQPREGKEIHKVCWNKSNSSISSAVFSGRVIFFFPSFAWQWGVSVLRKPKSWGKHFCLKFDEGFFPCLGWDELVWNSLVITEFRLCHLCDSSHVLSPGDCSSPFL